MAPIKSRTEKELRSFAGYMAFLLNRKYYHQIFCPADKNMYFYNHLMIKGSRKTGMNSMIIQKKYLPETAGGKVCYLELAVRLKTKEYDDSNWNENPADSNEYFQNR